MRGSCHCGKVRIEVANPPAWVGSCNCSLCTRMGTLMAYYHPDEVDIGPAGETDPYIWGDECIGIHHCRTCGCLTHWSSLGADYGRMGVNARLLEGFDPEAVEVRPIDGASF